MGTKLNRNGSAGQWKAGIYTRLQGDDEGRLAGIYTRISRDDEQERLGVQRQEEDGRAALGRRDLPIHRVYEDNDISGSGEEERPDFDDLIADLQNGTINAVWSWDVDRLTRGHKEYITFYETCEQVGALVMWLGGEANFAAGTGLLELEMRAAFAREELRKIKRRVARKHQEMAHKGALPVGKNDPYGYRKVKDETGKVVEFAVVKEEAAITRECARRVLAGEAITGVARDLDRRGLRTQQGRRWQRHTLRAILVNPVISGRRQHHGEIVAKGSWPEIIHPRTSDRLRELLLDPSRDVRTDVRQHLLSGMVNCGHCGARLVVARRSKEERHRPDFDLRKYVCRKGDHYWGCGKNTIAGDRLEHTVVERLLDLDATGKLRGILYAETTGKVEEAEAELATVKAELKELARTRYAKNMMPEEVEGAREALLERRALAEKIIQAAQREIGLPDLPDPLAPGWDTLPVHYHRTILKAAALSIKVMPAPNRGPFDPSRVITEWKD
jgi:site-specific DNA recombinase